MKFSVLLLLSALALRAETFEERYGLSPGKKALLKSQPAQQTVSDPSVFRVVDGQNYNIERSVLWIAFDAEYLKTVPEGILLQEVKWNRLYAPREVNSLQRIGAGGPPMPLPPRLIKEEKILGKIFVLRNYPQEPKPTVGQNISSKAIRVGSIEVEKQNLELWDLGVQYSPGAIVRARPVIAPTNRPTIRTNSPAQTNQAAAK
jgi:hypothetical protein